MIRKIKLLETSSFESSFEREDRRVQLKTGLRLKSVTDSTEVIVVRGTSEPVDLRCGGHAMVPASEHAMAAEVAQGFEGPTLIGKRYLDSDPTIELLCTKGGTAALSLGDVRLAAAGAKELPSSD
jgi:hypothetical protein